MKRICFERRWRLEFVIGWYPRGPVCLPFQSVDEVKYVQTPILLDGELSGFSKYGVDRASIVRRRKTRAKQGENTMLSKYPVVIHRSLHRERSNQSGCNFVSWKGASVIDPAVLSPYGDVFLQVHVG